MKTDAIRPPKRLAGDATKKFKELVTLLRARGVTLRAEDADRLAEYAETHIHRARAVAELANQPLILHGPNGAAYTNPLMKVIAQADRTLLNLSKLFGLDPKSRAAGGGEVAGAKPLSALAKFNMEYSCRSTAPDRTAPKGPTADDGDAGEEEG